MRFGGAKTAPATCGRATRWRETCFRPPCTPRVACPANDIAELPLEPGLLKARLVELGTIFPDERSVPENATPDDIGVIESVNRLLLPGVSPAELRSSLFVVLTSIAGVSVVDGTTDPIGRPAITISYTDEAWFGGTVTVYVSPDTTEVLATDGPAGRRVFRVAAWESEIPEPSADANYDLFGVYAGCIEGGSVVIESTGVLVHGPSGDPDVEIEDGDNLTQEEMDALENAPEPVCPSLEQVLAQIEQALATEA